MLTAATAVQIAIALIVLTRPSRDDVESADRARPATASVPSGAEQSPAQARTLPFAVRKEGFYRRGAAGSRTRVRGKIDSSPRTRADHPQPRLAPSPPPPPPPPPPAATSAATANRPPPPPLETATAAGRPPPQTVARSPGGGGDDDDDDEEGDDDDGGDEDDDGGGDDDGGDDDDGRDDDDGGGEDDD